MEFYLVNEQTGERVNLSESPWSSLKVNEPAHRQFLELTKQSSRTRASRRVELLRVEKGEQGETLYVLSERGFTTASMLALSD